ncbi:MAG: MerR family transcriptional regulator [Halioglobus sp.]
MAKHAKRSAAPQDRQYRMAELIDASGVSRDMIKYYLRAKLLPKPTKPRPNLSLYTHNHLLLIRLILRLQQQTTLSLAQISAAFRAANYDPTTIELELLSDKYSAGSRHFIIPFAAETRSEVSLSVPQEFIEELEASGLLDAGAGTDESQIEIAGLLWAARNEGVPISFFQAAREKLRALADIEVKALIAIARPQLDFNSVVASVTNTDRIINRWMISEKTGQARRMFQRIIDNSEQALSTVHEAIYFPSKVFRQRFNIEQELAGLGNTITANRRNLPLLHDACRACLLLADFERALAFADIAQSIERDDELAIACKCLAYGMDRNLEQALLYARRLEAADSRSAIALEARLLTLLMQAAKLGGMSDTTELLKQAAELFREPTAVPPKDNFDRLEACLLQARANTIFPDAINTAVEATRALEEMLESLASKSFRELGLPLEGVRVVYQVYACFYLGQLQEVAGDAARARQYFEQVIQLDPSSNFGEMAYLKLS